MQEFISNYMHEISDHRINPDVFERGFDKPLHEYAVDTCKNLEVLPGITLDHWELITDQTKIRTYINKKLARDPKVRNNRSLERFVTTNKSLYDLLILYFTVKVKDQVEHVVRQVRVPKAVKGKWFIRGGKKVLPLIQVVDNTTFVKNDVLNFKTALYAIKLSLEKTKAKFLDGESLAIPHFQIDLFTKTTNPLFYYVAQYGMLGTLEMFRVEKAISVVDTVLNEDMYRYLEINDNVYIEVHEKAIFSHPFVGRFLSTLYHLLSSDKKITLKEVYSKDYWLGRLAEVFSKKRGIDKGKRVLISFQKTSNPYIREKIKLKKFHKRDTARIVRWMMTNYDELIQKDGHDLINKRMRVNETQIYPFENYISRNVNSLLNTDNPSMEKYLKCLNSIGEMTLVRAGSGAKVSSSSMFRYERYNDFDAIELSRFTLKGPTGLNGGKQKTSMKYRDIYPSHYGRYDLNVCSSDPGLSGYLCANLSFDKDGYFDSSNVEPDVYDYQIDGIIDRFAEDDYFEKRKSHIKLELSRNKDGFIVLKRRKTFDELSEAIHQDPWKYGHRLVNGELKLMPNLGARDAKGFIQLKMRESKEDAFPGMPRDKDGFVILNRITKKTKN